MNKPSPFNLHWLLQTARPSAKRQGHQAEAGSILLTTLVVILVAMIGAATLMSKGVNSLSASSDASDLQTAKEAAETGFNEILAALNTDERSYLLVTKLANWGSGIVSSTDLDNCSIYHSSNSLPGPPAGYPSSTSFYKTTSFNGTVTYKLENYDPPISFSTPATCTKFGNLFGGSATFTVVGTLTRNGKQLSTFRLKKVVFIKGPFTESSEPFDAPLMITGTGPSSNNDVTKMDQKNLDYLRFPMPALPQIVANATARVPACKPPMWFAPATPSAYPPHPTSDHSMPMASICRPFPRALLTSTTSDRVLNMTATKRSSTAQPFAITPTTGPQAAQQPPRQDPRRSSRIS
ncbi:MAG: hypothetical protein WCQ20_06305 [Synechococcaceae cyanobacterium ELA739]